jgi:hypothetical protein
MAQPAAELPPGIAMRGGRWTAQRALAEIPETPELIIEVFDGSLVVSPRPNSQHQVALRELGYLLNRAAAKVGLGAYPEVNLVIGEDLAIPDIVVTPKLRGVRVWVDSSEVAMVVEIMSPGSKRDDRFVRPDRCARAGIEHHMRVEFRGEDPVIFQHKLVDGEYRPVIVAAAGTPFAMREPFPFEIDPVELVER